MRKFWIKLEQIPKNIVTESAYEKISNDRAYVKTQGNAQGYFIRLSGKDNGKGMEYLDWNMKNMGCRNFQRIKKELAWDRVE